MAEFWHFLGRLGVPLKYTWPAGRPGLNGYSYDRESSEFTVNHRRRTQIDPSFRPFDEQTLEIGSIFCKPFMRLQNEMKFRVNVVF